MVADWKMCRLGSEFGRVCDKKLPVNVIKSRVTRCLRSADTSEITDGLLNSFHFTLCDHSSYSYSANIYFIALT